MNKIVKKAIRKYDKKIQFTFKLLVFALILKALMWTNPEFPAAKEMTADIVATITGSEVIDSYYVKHGAFALMIVTDCVGWKELFVFFSLLFAWPLGKNWTKALLGALGILVYNFVRLAILILFNGSFDYFHPGFQIVSIIVILTAWMLSIEKKPKRKSKKKTKKKTIKKKK